MKPASHCRVSPAGASSGGSSPASWRREAREHRGPLELTQEAPPLRAASPGPPPSQTRLPLPMPKMCPQPSPLLSRRPLLQMASQGPPLAACAGTSTLSGVPRPQRGSVALRSAGPQASDASNHTDFKRPQPPQPRGSGGTRGPKAPGPACTQFLGCEFSGAKCTLQARAAVARKAKDSSQSQTLGRMK